MPPRHAAGGARSSSWRRAPPRDRSHHTAQPQLHEPENVTRVRTLQKPNFRAARFGIKGQSYFDTLINVGLKTQVYIKEDTEIPAWARTRGFPTVTQTAWPPKFSGKGICLGCASQRGGTA